MNHACNVVEIMMNEVNGRDVKNTKKNEKNEKMKSIFRELKAGNLDSEKKGRLWSELYSLLKEQAKVVAKSCGYRDFEKLVDEATQEAAIDMNEHFDTYDEKLGEVNTWTNSIIENAYKKVFRGSTEYIYERKGLVPIIKVDENGDEYDWVDEYVSAESPEDILMHNENCREIKEVVYSLSPKRRRALLLKVEGYSPSEIKEIMELKDDKSVYNLLNRARKDVDEKLGLNIYDRDRSKDKERDD